MSRKETVPEAIKRGVKVQVLPPVTAEMGQFLMDMEDLADKFSVIISEDDYIGDKHDGVIRILQAEGIHVIEIEIPEGGE